MRPGASISVDIGGTFTDAVLKCGETLYAQKTLTTHGDLLKGFFNGVDSVLAQAGLRPPDVGEQVVHATTIVTNALIERRGAATALIVTEGFRDVLILRDERRYDVYDPQIEYPVPLVPREMVFTIDERTLADGSIERELRESDIEDLVSKLRAANVQSVGICLLNSYRNPENERLLAAGLGDRMPELSISLSVDVAPQIREYLRASTVAANAYAIPITEPYLGGMTAKLEKAGFPSKPLIMLSSGGTVGPHTAARMPVRMIESGPAAGALGASLIAQALNLEDLLAFDMGGTTAKVCLIQNHKPLVTGRFEIDRMFRFKEGSGLPITVPCIDLIEIGAGGGSIADIDVLGLLKVGPRSAGSVPGPVAYGRGGTQPTVTDANTILGLIDPERFLGGTMPLDVVAATRALAQLGARIGLDATQTARGIFSIVTEAMAGAVKAHSAERGVDCRGIPILAFGGAGPLHACEVARLLGSRTVIFPPHASVLSAFGALLTPLRIDLVRSKLCILEDADWSAISALVGEMEEEGRQILTEAGCNGDDIHFGYEAEMRYIGQQHELRVELPGRVFRMADATTFRDAFEVAYEKTYRLIQPEVAVEMVAVRVTVKSPDRPLPLLHPTDGDTSPKPLRRWVGLWDGFDATDVHARDALRADTVIKGPAVIEEAGTTLVLPPEWSARLGPLGCVIAEAEGGA